MHYTPHTQDTCTTRRVLLPHKPHSADKSNHFNRVTTGGRPKKFLRCVQHPPSAQGQEGLPRKGGGRAGQEASSSGKGQHVALGKSGGRQNVPPHRQVLRTLWALGIIGVTVCGDWGRRHRWSGSTAIRWRRVSARRRRRGHIRSRS